jgi:hypothetical protein
VSDLQVGGARSEKGGGDEVVYGSCVLDSSGYRVDVEVSLPHDRGEDATLGSFAWPTPYTAAGRDTVVVLKPNHGKPDLHPDSLSLVV